MALRSLRALTLLFLLIFLAATVVTGVTTYVATRATITQIVDERIAAASEAVAGASYPARRDVVITRIGIFSKQRDTGDLGFALYDEVGRQIAGNVVPRRVLPTGRWSIGKDIGIRGLTSGRALVREIGDGMTLATFAETEPIDNYNAARVKIYIFGFGSIILIVVVGLTAFGRAIGRRMRDQRRTVQAIIDGDMRRRVPVDGSDSELDQQAQAFNRMLDRIAELMAGIRNVSNDIAHDLRTPLARLRGQLSALSRSARTDRMRAGIDDAIAQCDEILAMFAAVLRIAEVEEGERSARFEPLDLAALAADVVETMQPVAAESGHSLALLAGTPVAVRGDRQLLSQALINLIDNATRHTPPGTHVVVAVSFANGAPTLAVSDDGPGIPGDQHALALRRFGRLDKSRATEGHGLGLAMVGAVMRLHRGSIALEDAGPGLRVVLEMPAEAR